MHGRGFLPLSSSSIGRRPVLAPGEMRFCVMAVTAEKLSIFLSPKHRRAMVAHEKQQLEARNVARSRIGRFARVACLDWRLSDQAATDIRPPRRTLCGIVRDPSGGRLCFKDLPDYGITVTVHSIQPTHPTAMDD